MKQGWEITKLEEVVEFQRGLTYSKKDEVDFSDNIVLRSNNVDLFRHKLDFSELKYINPSIEIPENKKVKKGSLLICTANGSKSHLGKVALIDGDYNYSFGGFMGLISPNHKIDSKFLFYLMTSENYKKFINELSDGANINNLKFSDLGQFKIPLPPLPEQQRIVSILDACFAAIDKAKAHAAQNLKNAKELFESYLQGVFTKKGDGWEEKKLGEVFEIKPPKKEAREKLNDNDLVSFLPMEDLGVCENAIKPRIEKPLKDVTGSYTYFAENDVLLAKITPCFENGKLGVAKNLTNGIGFGSSEYIVFRCPDFIVPEYLFYFLSRASLREEGQKYMSGAVGHKRVSKDWIENFQFSFPPLKDQQTIVRQLDALRAETQKLEAVYQQKIADLEELKKSILQKAFAGELKTEKAVAV
jgi:type I restriction enzyme S subunit